MTNVNRCYYEILGVDQDSDDGVIKKAYRKMALKFHPDKNVGNEEEAANEFRLVQQSYECLSDPAERKWYDEHRDMILRGIKVGEGEGAGADAAYVFDVNSYHFFGCFNGYGDGEDGFFSVYRNVFQQVVDGELKGWVSEGNIDETEMPNFHLLNVSFGRGSSDWSEVSAFYNAWESFSTCLGFAWADKYDSRDAQSRWERRRMEEENKKARKVAKKKRNADVVSLVNFVKKKDPRVETARKKAEQEKIERQSDLKKQAEKKKQEKAAAKEAWMEKREEQLRQLEMEDINAGRVRLADLDDSDDDFYGGKRKKKGKKGKKKNKSRWDSDNDENATNEVPNQSINSNEVPNGTSNEQTGDFVDQDPSKDTNNTDINDAPPQDLQDEYYSDELSSEEEEPEIWRCEVCRKDFKSEMQLKNHLKSKKHKEALKKWEKKQKKKAKEDQLMDELLDELDDLKT